MGMTIRYSLSVDDHLAWYDYYLSILPGPRFLSWLPFIEAWLSRRRRERYARQILANAPALGTRSLEVSTEGVREFADLFDFTTPWPDVALVAVTARHLFIAHASMNSHIVPLSAFDNQTARDAFTSFAQSHATTSN